MTNVHHNALKIATALMVTIATNAAGIKQDINKKHLKMHLKRCVENTGCTDNNQCNGHDAICNIPAHDNCFYCDLPSANCTEGTVCETQSYSVQLFIDGVALSSLVWSSVSMVTFLMLQFYLFLPP